MTDVALIEHAPTSKEEDWRYTPVKKITSSISASETANRSVSQALTTLDIDLVSSDLGGPRLVFVNGFYSDELSVVENLPTGLFCGTANENNSKSLDLVDKVKKVRTIEGFYDEKSDFDVALIMAEVDVNYDQPIHVVHVAQSKSDETKTQNDTDTKIISHPRTVIDLGKNSHLTVVETFCGFSNNSVTDATTTIRLGDNAQLDQCRIQNEHEDTTHVGHTQIEQGSGSKMNMASITIGADIARNAIDVQLSSPDALLDLTGVNITNRHQVHDTVVTADHSASHCTSNQRFVGVVNDHGRGSFGGEIIVQKGTVGTDANQTNRNLVLDDYAKADTRPWLRIFADDVQCTHGATVGRLDDDALFYLRSRGIELSAARTMLIDAFIADITNTIANDTVREAVASLISATTISPKEIK